MLFNAALLTTFVSAALAVPLSPRASSVSEADVLNFALTLEHLEVAFYTGALAKFTPKDFTDAGIPDWVYPRYQEIAQHEEAHVDTLFDALNALGAPAVQPCTYNFPYTTPAGFIHISSSLETVGASAYAGATKYLQNSTFLEVAASILATEARQSAWISGSVQMVNPWSGAYETPLSLNQVFTLASQFIVSCPSTNPTLPVTAYAQVSVGGSTPGSDATPGSSASFSFTPGDGFNASKPLFVVYQSGRNFTVVPVSSSPPGSKRASQATARYAPVPKNARGTNFGSVTSDPSGTDDTQTVAGPALLDFSYNSAGTLVKPTY